MNGVKKFTCLLVLISAFVACNDNNDDNKITKQEELILRANQFIHDHMSTFYLWSEEMPNIDYQKEKDPIAYFKKLLVKEDSASIITDDAQGLLESFNNTNETFGYSLIFYPINYGKNYIAVVKYVYPNSPAAGKLKRGDIIIAVNNAMITESNYTQLNQNGTISLSKGKLNGTTISNDGEPFSLTSKKMDSNPVLINKVIEKGKDKIGYLMYTDFAYTFNDNLKNAFNEFKSKGITELVLDLRYNHGGDDAASTLMCSAIAPKDKAKDGELLSHEKWNTLCQKAFESKPEYDEQIHRYFQQVDCNLDLPNKRVYILTTRETASASEYVAICLKPFMEVILIGTKTYGKHTTMMLMQPLKEDENGETVLDEELSNWLIAPVVSRYTNTEGEPSFTGGMEPDYKVEDELLPTAFALGDENEPLLAKAIELITQVNRITPRRAVQPALNWQPIEIPLNDIRSNRIIYKNIK